MPARVHPHSTSAARNPSPGVWSGSIFDSAAAKTRLVTALCAAAFAVLLSSCDSPLPPTAHPASGQARIEAPADLQSQKMAFLHKIREADANRETIDRALMNDRGELGVILNRSVELAAIPPLMKSLLTEMAASFPGEDLSIAAYTPSAPPMLLGEARFNTRTREMTYTPVR